MPLPIEQQALQDVGPPQERRVRRARPADHHMRAAARAGVASVGHELVGAQAARAGVGIDPGGDVDRLAPGGGGLHIDLDDAGIGGDLQDAQARVGRRSIALQPDRQVLGGGLQLGDQFEVVLQARHRRHEDVEPAVPRLDAERGPHRWRLATAWPRLAGIRRLDPRIVGEGSTRLVGVEGHDVRVVLGLQLRQRVERQAQAERRVPRGRVEPSAPESPGLAQPPLALGLRERAAKRQDIAEGLGEPALHDAPQPRAGGGIVQGFVGQLDVGRQVGLGLHRRQRILARRQGQQRIDAQAVGEPPDQAVSVGDGRGRLTLLRQVGGAVAPDRPAVVAPVEAKRPAGQGLARIPLALAEMQHAARPETVPQPAQQLLGEDRLGGPRGVDVPLGRLEVVDGDEGRLAAHGQAHVLGLQVGFDAVADRVQRRPIYLLERPGDADRLDQAGDRHREVEVVGGAAGPSADRRGGPIVRRGRERDVPFAAQQARGGVEADPAGAGDVDLRPGVQVGEVRLGPQRPFDRVDVGLQLQQVARDEARREPQPAQHLDQQPGAVAAGARPRLPDLGVGADDEIHGSLPCGLEFRDRGRQSRTLVVEGHVGREIVRQGLRIGERQPLGIGLDEEVEGVDHHHLGGEVDGDAALPRRLREDDPRQPVAVRILLPVDEVLGGRDLHRVAGDAGPRMRRGPQAHHMRAKLYRLIVAIAGDVVEGGDDRQGTLWVEGCRLTLPHRNPRGPEMRWAALQVGFCRKLGRWAVAGGRRGRQRGGRPHAPRDVPQHRPAGAAFAADQRLTGPPGGPGGSPRRRELAHPDVPEAQRGARIAMRLQLDGSPRIGPVDRLADVERFSRKHRVVLDQDAIVQDGHACWGRDLAVACGKTPELPRPWPDPVTFSGTRHSRCSW